ncbi:MAG TPA: discoidin domain-containing protein, partial [Nitrosopumilaceae archaeon]|nr:discoidin domain-containing protein [Nitrosopumilaceae archaeon]
MNKRVIIFFLFISSGLFAQLKKYTFSRPVKGISENAYYTIPLGTDILAKSQSGYTDFRIFETGDNDTIEVPYTLNWKDEEIQNMEYAATLVDASYKTKCCSFVTLKFNEPKEINEIKLEVSENNFDKLLKLEGSSDNKDWKTIQENMRIVGFGFDDYKYTKLNFGICTYRYFRITVNNLNSKAINITGATTYYNHYLIGSYTLINDVKVLRSEKKTEGKNYQTARGKYISVQEANETELKVILPYKACIHHLILRSKDSADFYRYVTVGNMSKNIWR